MSIKPIDLQALFTHINQVGREQAQHKDSLLVQQAAAGRELAEEAQHKAHSVNETKEMEDALENIKEEGHENNRDDARHRHGKEQDEKDEAKKEILRDPALGKHIDISG